VREEGREEGILVRMKDFQHKKKQANVKLQDLVENHTMLKLSEE
jgi:hypothetical protein